MQKIRRAAFHTLGCKLNFSETSAISRQLEENGFVKVDFGEKADIYVINTCSVTENADRECRSIINRALSKNPLAFIAVTGCFAQLKPELIAGMSGVDLVLGAREKFNLASFLSDLEKKDSAAVMACEIGEVTHFEPACSAGDRTRAFLKVQDGCDYNCSFCTIPLARGKSRSGTIDQVLAQVTKLTSKGIREIVLTGVNLGDTGIQEPGSPRAYRFYDLARALEELDMKIRIRISSIEPNLLSKSIIDLVAGSEKFMPHFHIPLQSGSDRILKLMKRRYLTSLYAERISYIKNVIPHACIGADVITGFPGESEEDFEATRQFISSLGLSYLHVFTYSERDHTEAISMPGLVPHYIRKSRNRALRILSDKKLMAFYRSQQGSRVNVLFESADKEGNIYGYSENYIRVKAAAGSGLENQNRILVLDKQDENGCYLFNHCETAGLL